MLRRKRLLGYFLLVLAIIGCSYPGPVIKLPTPVASESVGSSSCTYRNVNNQVLPDSRCTPGAINPQVTQETIGTTICKSGWARTVRPPVSYTEPLKFQSMRSYHVTVAASAIEFDHLVPIEMGGAPEDIRNLWAEPIENARLKDKAENAGKAAICNGHMTLLYAQNLMASDWTELAIQLGVFTQ